MNQQLSIIIHPVHYPNNSKKQPLANLSNSFHCGEEGIIHFQLHLFLLSSPRFILLLMTHHCLFSMKYAAKTTNSQSKRLANVPRLQTIVPRPSGSRGRIYRKSYGCRNHALARCAHSKVSRARTTRTMVDGKML